MCEKYDRGREMTMLSKTGNGRETWCWGGDHSIKDCQRGEIEEMKTPIRPGP